MYVIVFAGLLPVFRYREDELIPERDSLAEFVAFELLFVTIQRAGHFIIAVADAILKPRSDNEHSRIR